MRIGIVGAGIAGLAAARVLAREHQVQVYERDAHAGGHAHTAVVRTAAGEIAVDTGFIVYNETTYPGFSAMLRELDVPTQASDMSFGCRCLSCGLEYSSRGLSGFFAQRRMVLRSRHWRLLADLRAFFAEARRLLETGDGAELTLGAWLASRVPGRDLGGHFLVPLTAAVWSTAPAEVLDFPLLHLLRFLSNHGLIGMGRTLRWRTVNGGSREYVRRLVASLPGGAVRLSAGARAVRPLPDGGVEILLSGGDRPRFDRVVLATHADHALALLPDATSREREALGGFRYSSNRVVLHTDAARLPRTPKAGASWNVTTEDCLPIARALTMTYDLSRLQSLSGPERFLVSVNPRTLDPRRVHAEYTYDHPRYGFDTLAAQRRVALLQGSRGLYFAGAHLGYGFHEDGYRSGTEVAALLAGARRAAA